MILDATGHPVGGAKAVLRPSGAILVDGQQVADTVQCAHCGQHFILQPGSGRRRGFCLKCEGLTCGSASCAPCVPIERRLELRERAGR